MKNVIKRLLLICAVVSLCVSVCITASAENERTPVRRDQLPSEPYWIEGSASVPGLNSSAFTKMYGYKVTEDFIASFRCTYKSDDRNFDARMVNSDKAARSAWARDLDIDVIIYAKEESMVKPGYLYSCEISSDLFTLGTVDVEIDFCPDEMTS